MTELILTSWFVAQADGADAAERGTTLLKMVNGGGVIGYIIVGLSVVALALIVVHLLQIRRKVLVPPEHLERIDAMLSTGDLNGALEYSLDPDHDSYLTRILAAGLTRFQKSAFGAFEIKNSIEEAGEEQTARLYRSTDALGVIGSIAPLLGLLGTVQGMIGAFDTVSLGAVNDANYYESLAGNISLALITTLQGLIVAIPCVALFTYFRNRIDAIASEAAMEIERLVIHLESTPGVARPAMAPPAQPRALSPSPRPAPAAAAVAAPPAPAPGGGQRS